MDKNGEGFKYHRTVFPGLSDDKLKEGVFVGPQFRKVISEKITKLIQNKMQRNLKHGNNLMVFFYGFLVNKKEANHKQLLQNLLQTYQILGCRMSLKIHILHSHFGFFSPENLSSFSDEQGERFYQDILRMEQRYKGKWDVSMMSDYCRFLIREYMTTHKKKSLKR